MTERKREIERGREKRQSVYFPKPYNKPKKPFPEGKKLLFALMLYNFAIITGLYYKAVSHGKNLFKPECNAGGVGSTYGAISYRGFKGRYYDGIWEKSY